MKTVAIIIAVMLCMSQLQAQNIYTDKAGKVSFFSKTPLEDIEAHNTQALGIIGLATGSVGVSILIKGFKFKKALMEEHFNENYLESDKYPKAIFNGKILDFETLNFFDPKGIEATVVGNITLHGVTQPIHGTVSFKPEGENLRCATEFKLKPENFDIKIPGVVINNIAKVIDVEAHFLISKKK